MHLMSPINIYSSLSLSLLSLSEKFTNFGFAMQQKSGCNNEVCFSMSSDRHSNYRNKAPVSQGWMEKCLVKDRAKGPGIGYRYDLLGADSIYLLISMLVQIVMCSHSQVFE